MSETTLLEEIIQEPLTNSNRLADSNADPNCYITIEEARERGIPIKTPPPPPDICQFCGKEHQRKGILFSNMVMFWQPFPTRCNCSEAVSYWKEYDDEKERKKLETERRLKIEEIEGELYHGKTIHQRK